MALHHVLFVASEIFPLAKTGGLADVGAALPAALARLGADIHLVMPGYEQALDLAEKPHVSGTLDGILGFEGARIVTARTPDSGLSVSLVDIPALYRDGGGIYVDADGSDRRDNAIRFGALCHAAAGLAAGRAGSAWRPNIVHCNDWHTGLLPLILRHQAGPRGPATVFTVHNMSFQGLFPWEQSESLDLPRTAPLYEGLEFYGHVSFLKAGLYFSDFLTTVSPTYAREISTPEYGYGLDPLIRARADRLLGILNGIDTEFWSPLENPALPVCYSARDLTGKRNCKRALQKELGLVENDQAPLISFVGRLSWQKMADVLRDGLPKMLEAEPDRQFTLLGQGDDGLEKDFAAIAQRFPGRVAVQTAYSEHRAHRLHAGADILIHGSRFEPCGLTQLYAMRFGTIPVVRPVGGLADTVVDATDQALAERTATGFHFQAAEEGAMLSAIDRAVAAFRQPLVWRRMQRAAMQCDFSWERSASEYLGIYERLAPTLRKAGADTAAREIA